MRLSVDAESTAQIIRWPCELIIVLIGHWESPTAENKDRFITEVCNNLTFTLVTSNLEPELPQNLSISMLINILEDV